MAALEKASSYPNPSSNPSLEPKLESAREPLLIVPSAGSAINLRQNTNALRAARLAEQAYRALHIGFVALALLAGVDKFANVLADWGEYLAPIIPSTLNVSGGAFMLGVGVFEILLGIGLTVRPKLFGDIFAAYLVAIVANLLLLGQFYDVALFDFALSAGACGLARLSYSRSAARSRRLDNDSVTRSPGLRVA